MLSPLEQFEIIYWPYNSFFCRWFEITPTNLTVFCFFIIFVVFFSFDMSQYNKKIIPTHVTVVITKIVDFFTSIVIENLGLFYSSYFLYLFTIFLFVLLSNAVGMVPYTYTVTSQFAVTFCLALSLFFGLNYIGIKKHGFKFLGLFLPSGTPLEIAPFVIIVEIISYLARVFSLSIRLFANLMSGHTLLKILAGFGWIIVQQFGFSLLLSILPVAIISAVVFLETAIAFLQSYVFSVLALIYIGDSVKLH